jgi:hypothetical protein
MMYDAYVRVNKRRVICEREIDKQRALDFLVEVKHGLVIREDGFEFIKEELKYYVESFRPNSGVGEDSESSGGGSIHEDSDSELFDLTKYYTKPSSERDN